VGALQYATFSRPEIIFLVHRVSLFMHSLTEKYWPLSSELFDILKVLFPMVSLFMPLLTYLCKSSVTQIVQAVLMIGDQLRYCVFLGIGEENQSLDNSSKLCNGDK
jgi:hypothetical protein